MAILELEVYSYRNLEDGRIQTDSEEIFLIGENGQGKTNLLDAIYTLCYGSSFRARVDSENARLGSKSWSVMARTGAYNDSLENSYQVKWENGSKTLRENEKNITDRKIFVEANPAVLFCHEDMEFARGEPERRRFFFDQTAGLVDGVYIDQLRVYRKTLKSRNVALKGRMLDILDVLDLQLVTVGRNLMAERQKLVKAFEEVFPASYETVSELGEAVKPVYRPSWPIDSEEADVLKILGASRERELILGTTCSGPHRDRYLFTDSSGDFSGRASTGQLRLMALTLRMAQAVYYRNMTGRKPMLLLDDVLLELDPDKRKRLMENLPPYEQAFFTFLPGEVYRDYISDKTLVYWTSDGKFQHKKSG